jgi:hypothetical protein
LATCGRSNSQSYQSVSIMSSVLTGADQRPLPKLPPRSMRLAPASEPPLKRTKEKVQLCEPCAAVKAPAALLPRGTGEKLQVRPAVFWPTSRSLMVE